jgi:hypothetical protein
MAMMRLYAIYSSIKYQYLKKRVFSGIDPEFARFVKGSVNLTKEIRCRQQYLRASADVIEGQRITKRTQRNSSTKTAAAQGSAYGSRNEERTRPLATNSPMAISRG